MTSETSISRPGDEYLVRAQNGRELDGGYKIIFNEHLDLTPEQAGALYDRAVWYSQFGTQPFDLLVKAGLKPERRLYLKDELIADLDRKSVLAVIRTIYDRQVENDEPGEVDLKKSDLLFLLGDEQSGFPFDNNHAKNPRTSHARISLSYYTTETVSDYPLANVMFPEEQDRVNQEWAELDEALRNGTVDKLTLAKFRVPLI